VRSPDTLTSPATRNRIPPQWWPWCSTAARLVLAGVWAVAGAAAADGPRSLRKLGRDGLFLCLAILVAAGAPSRLALDNLVRD